MTAIAAFLGTYFGLMFRRNEYFEDMLLSAVSGGFIYIATTSMIPMLLKSKQKSLKQILFEFVAISLGVLLMACVLLLEDHDHSHNHDHIGNDHHSFSHDSHHHHDHHHHDL